MSSSVCAIDVKYSLNFIAIVLESVKDSPLIISSSGNALEDDDDPLFTVRKCRHRVLLSFKFSTEVVKCLRFALLIKFLVLLRKRLYTV